MASSCVCSSSCFFAAMSPTVFAELASGTTILLSTVVATDLTAKTYVSLGDLKGLDGDYQYSIPTGTDLESLKYVIVWCVDFDVSFGHAVLP